MRKKNLQILAKIQFLNITKYLTVLKYFFYYLDKLYLLFIPKPKIENSKKQVLLLANLGLGDAMNFLSVAKKYRDLYPKNKFYITILVPKGIDIILREETEFDSIICVDFNSAIVNLVKRFKLIKLVNFKNYDVLIDIMGIVGASINVYLCNASYAKEKITINNIAYSSCPTFLQKKGYSKVYTINNTKISNVEYYNYLYDFINNEKSDIVLHKTKNYKLSLNLPLKYYIVFPGASSDFRKWSADNYINLIEKIYNKISLPVVFLGTLKEKEIVDYITSSLKKKKIKYESFLGQTTTLEFIQAIKTSSFIITNDTGSYHIAVNEEVPVTLITGAYALDMYALYDFLDEKYRKPYVVYKNKKCKNCFYKCPYIDKAKVWPCLNEISVDDAWKIVEKMIDCELK